MSIDNIKAFWTRVQADEALRNELNALRSEHDAIALAGVTALGSRYGFVFTPDEYRAAIRAKAASEIQSPAGLSDADLDVVAGGGPCCACGSSMGGPHTG
jgi:predicted ribosomally synthesized peptide with nif11-like leader